MYFKDYLALCEADDLEPYTLFSLLELEEAKRHALNMALAQKRIETLELSEYAKIRMTDWIKQEDGKRMMHMLNALEYAESMRGIKTFDKALKAKWRKWGMTIPTF